MNLGAIQRSMDCPQQFETPVRQAASAFIELPYRNCSLSVRIKAYGTERPSPVGEISPRPQVPAPVLLLQMRKLLEQHARTRSLGPLNDPALSRYRRIMRLHLPFASPEGEGGTPKGTIKSLAGSVHNCCPPSLASVGPGCTGSCFRSPRLRRYRPRGLHPPRWPGRPSLERGPCGASLPCGMASTPGPISSSVRLRALPALRKIPPSLPSPARGREQEVSARRAAPHPDPHPASGEREPSRAAARRVRAFRRLLSRGRREPDPPPRPPSAGDPPHQGGRVHLACEERENSPRPGELRSPTLPLHGRVKTPLPALRAVLLAKRGGGDTPHPVALWATTLSHKGRG